MQEPAQPDTLTAPIFAHPVHAIVPVACAHQRQAMRAGGRALCQRPAAVFIERIRLVRRFKLAVSLDFIGRERFALQERDSLL